MADQHHTEDKNGSVRCDGGSQGLGHPAIYLSFGDQEEVVCPYCSKKFVREA